MWDLKGVKGTLLILSAIALTFASCQDVVQKNETKTVDLQDPQVDGTVKSALENGSVSEVVVRKDLLLFPVNAPNLVIAHRQEIHAVPQTNGSNETDGKPTVAQVAEVNEYSLSQLVSTNDTDNQNETAGGGVPISSSPFSSDTQNSTVLAPGKLLEIPSGFNLTDGLVTEKVALPDEVQNVSVPKQSIVDILSKSLAQQETTTLTPIGPSSYEYVKRSIDSDEDGDDNSDSDSAEQNGNASENTTEIVKRSVDSDESLSVENDSSSSSATSTTEGSTSSTTASSTTAADVSTSTTAAGTSTSTENMQKRSSESGDDSDDDSTSDSTEYYDHEVNGYSKRDVGSTISTTLKSSSQPDEQQYDSSYFKQEKKSLREDSPEDMDVAEDIVFRPLFRYRQETQLRQSSNDRRRGYNDYNNNDYGNQDDADYN